MLSKLTYILNIHFHNIKIINFIRKNIKKSSYNTYVHMTRVIYMTNN